jgi:hypothetical protein
LEARTRWREFIWLLGATLGWSLSVQAQQLHERTRVLGDSLRVQAESAASKIVQFIGEIEGWLGPWSVQPTDTQMRMELLILLRQVPAITEVAQINGAGKEKIRVTRVPIELAATEQDYSQNPKFTGAITNKVYYGPVYFSPSSGAFMTLSISNALGEPGARVAEISLKSIQDTMRATKVGNHGVAYVVDGQGHVFAHPDIGRVQQDFSRLAHVRSARPTPTGPTAPAEGGQIPHDIEGREVLAVYAPVSSPPLGWLVFVELPTGEISTRTTK